MSRTLNQFPVMFCNEYTQFKKKCCYQPLIIYNRTPITDFSNVVVLSKATNKNVPSNLNRSLTFQQTYIVDVDNILFGKNRCIS